MDKTGLIACLQEHFDHPQKSERWAMYRLISPIVDYANLTLAMRPYFEFNQTSAHGTSQAVDIALLDNGKPAVMVEAKRVDRRISADQISKYLQPGVRGLVTNGVNWIMCFDGKSRAVSLTGDTDGQIATEVLNEVVAFIRGEKQPHARWSTEVEYMEPKVRPEVPKKASRARRRSNPVVVAMDTDSFLSEVANLEKASQLDRLLLQSLVAELERQGGMPQHLRCEIRASRVAFFDERVGSGSKRTARVELGKKQPDILVLSSLVTDSTGLEAIAPSDPHDKGPHMRRFRLSNEAQTEQFAVALAKVLGN